MRPVDDRSADFEDRVPAGSARRRLLIPPLQSQHAGDDRPGVLLTCDASMRQCIVWRFSFDIPILSVPKKAAR